jgi:hypothetical protein
MFVLLSDPDHGASGLAASGADRAFAPENGLNRKNLNESAAGRGLVNENLVRLFAKWAKKAVAIAVFANQGLLAAHLLGKSARRPPFSLLFRHFYAPE